MVAHGAAGRQFGADGRAENVRRGGNFGSDPALGGYEGIEDHRGDQQRRGRAHLRSGRLWHSRRFVRGGSRVGGSVEKSESLAAYLEPYKGASEIITNPTAYNRKAPQMNVRTRMLESGN